MPRRPRARARATRADGEEAGGEEGLRHAGDESSDTSEDGGDAQQRAGSSSSSSSSSDSSDLDGSETDSVDEQARTAQRKAQKPTAGTPAVGADSGLEVHARMKEKEPELLVELSDEEGEANQDTRWALQEMEEDDVSSDDDASDEDDDDDDKGSETTSGNVALSDMLLPDASTTTAASAVGSMQSLLEADAYVAESQEEDEELENKAETEDEDERMRATPYEVQEAKWLIHNIKARVSRTETRMLQRGLKPDGPPFQLPIAHSDEFARKFRWPQHLRNLRNVDFSQDASEILQDYELEPDASSHQVSTEEEEGKPALRPSAFAPVPGPMLVATAKSARQTSRKRKLPTNANQAEDLRKEAPSAAELVNIARLGTRFGDQFLGTLLSANARALQGLGESEEYDQRCWTPLPLSKKPIANWRFVMEHLRKRNKTAMSKDSVCPPMKQATLIRIQDRLKQLYGLSWQPEDDDFFKEAPPNSASNPSNVADVSGSHQDMPRAEEGEEISF